MNKEDIKKFLENKKNLLLLIIIGFGILIRLYYFFKVGEQPIWWDEGDYLAIAKGFIYNWQNQEWWTNFTGMRPLLIPIIWAGFFLFNSPEMVIRFFTLLIPSILSIYLVYAIGRDLYNKEVGLISSLMLSVYWVHLFYTYRLLTDIPAMFFGLLSTYYFWSWYIKREKISGLYLSIIFGVLGISSRFTTALIPLTFILFLLITRKLNLLKDKSIWKGIIFSIFCISPYIIYFILNKFYLIKFYFGENATSIIAQISIIDGFRNVLGIIPGLLGPVIWYKSIWFLTLLIGSVYLINLVIGFDIIWKQKTKTLNSDLFVTLWIIIHLAFFILIERTTTDRWLLMLMPALFFISSKGILVIFEYTKMYNKEIAILIISVLLIGGLYQNVKHTNELINLKKDSYKEEKLAGEWIKEDFQGKNPKIVTASIVQLAYYTNGYTYEFYTKNRPKECIDLYGSLNLSEYCQTTTEEQFNQKLDEINPDYLIVHIFEPYFTPQWAYTYAERHSDILEPVQGYNQNNQPVLIIYKFKK